MTSSSSSRRSYSSFTDAFYGFLSAEVENLDRLFQSENSTMSINFLQQVLSSLRSVHSEMTLLIPRLDLPVGEKWIDEYMDESARLWEASRLFKKSVPDMSRYYSQVENTILPSINRHPQRIYEEWHTCQEAMRALEGESKAMVERRAPALCLNFDPNINSKVVAEPQFNKFNGFRGALDAMKTVTTLLLAILLSGFVYFCPETSYFSQGAYDETEVFRQDFRGFTVSLHRKLSRVISGSKAGILALRRLELAVEELRVASVVADVRANDERVKEMERLVEGLRGGAAGIIDELDEFVDEIIEARKMIKTYVIKSS